MRPEDVEERTLASFVAYVAGEDEVPQTVSRVRGIPRETLQQVLDRHRDQLTAIDPAREVILQSIYGRL